MENKDDRLLKLKMDLDDTVLSSVQQIYKVKKGLKNKLTKKEVEIGLLKSISENFLRLKQIDDEMEKHIEEFVLFIDERLERERDFNLLKDLTALELMENKDLNAKIQKAVKLQGGVEYEDEFSIEVDKLLKINQNDRDFSK